MSGRERAVALCAAGCPFRVGEAPDVALWAAHVPRRGLTRANGAIVADCAAFTSGVPAGGACRALGRACGVGVPARIAPLATSLALQVAVVPFRTLQALAFPFFIIRGAAFR